VKNLKIELLSKLDVWRVSRTNIIRINVISSKNNRIIFLEQAALQHMSLEQMSLEQMSLEQMSLEQMSLKQMSLEQMSLKQMSLEKCHWGNKHH
jgi:uncharacterized protein YjbI with pentapeptide repeats